MLKCVDPYKDLWVIMSRDLSWSNHVDVSVNKANKVLGLLKRSRQEQRNLLSTLWITFKTCIGICKPGMITLSCQRQTGHWKRATRSIKNCPWAKTTWDVIWKEVQITGREYAWTSKRINHFSLVECYNTASESNGLESRGYFEYCNNNNRSNNPFHTYEIRKSKRFQTFFLRENC